MLEVVDMRQLLLKIKQEPNVIAKYCWFSFLSVQKNYNAVQKKPNISMWRPKYIKYCLIGKTYKAIILYACFYISSLLYYDFAIQHETCENISDDNVTHLVSLNYFLLNNR